MIIIEKVLLSRKEVYQLLKDGYDMPRGWSSEISQPLWHSKVLHMWRHMWLRCYDETHPRNKDYKDSIIHNDFLKFSNYLLWFTSQPSFTEFCKTCNSIRWSVDKDMKVKGNKHYYPQYMTLCTLSENSSYRNRNYDYSKMNNCFNDSKIQERCAKSKWKPIIGINSYNILLYKSVSQCQKDGFDPSTVVKCIKGKHKMHKGYHWKYINYKHNFIFRRVNSVC